MAMTSAATVTTQVDQTSVDGRRAVMIEPASIAPSAMAHTAEMPKVIFLKPGAADRDEQPPDADGGHHQGDRRGQAI
jgi:hypothetical protein